MMIIFHRILHWIKRVAYCLFVLIISLLLLSASTIPQGDQSEQVRAYTREVEFDFIEWLLNAWHLKISGSALDLEKVISEDQTRQIVQDYLLQVAKVRTLSAEVEFIFADPAVANPEAESMTTRTALAAEEQRLDDLAKIAEPILQKQVSDALASLGLSAAGQVLPPVAYHVSALPLNLVISPRDEIRRISEVSLESGLNAQEKDTLEQEIQTDLALSALVVPIGGLSAYPTMVMQTTDLTWLLDTIAHEWTHTYLTFHPLGMNYYTNGAMRTINETTASLVGKEISLEVLRAHYPEWLPTESVSQPQSATPEEPPAFDYRAEMRITRVATDALLAEGKIDEAEAYMEARRQFFWQNGYLIRKLNQAYFAFYGAYNDEPGGGASGDDPVGPLVVELRSKSGSLAEFIRTIARVNTYEELVAITASMP